MGEVTDAWIRTKNKGKWHRTPDAFDAVQKDGTARGGCNLPINLPLELRRADDVPDLAERCQAYGCLTEAERAAKPRKIQPNFKPPPAANALLVKAAGELGRLLNDPRSNHAEAHGHVFDMLHREWPSLYHALRAVQRATKANG